MGYCTSEGEYFSLGCCFWYPLPLPSKAICFSFVFLRSCVTQTNLVFSPVKELILATLSFSPRRLLSAAILFMLPLVVTGVQYRRFFSNQVGAIGQRIRAAGYAPRSLVGLCPNQWVGPLWGCVLRTAPLVGVVAHTVRRRRARLFLSPTDVTRFPSGGRH